MPCVQKSKLPDNIPASTTAHLLLNNPPDIAEWRKTLYEVIGELDMTWEDWQARWPYVSNFWSRQETGRFDVKTLTRKDLYYYRRWRVADDLPFPRPKQWSAHTKIRRHSYHPDQFSQNIKLFKCIGNYI